MGSDDLFKKKRAAKKNAELARKPANKKALAKILIVCEGLKTEPGYFKDLISHFDLLTASVIDVSGDCGSSPMCVYQHARKKYTEMQNQGAPYDEIYIVIDKDAHTDYMATLDAIQRSRPQKIWIATNSVPCFEYWLLLHYTYTTKAYLNLPNNSSGKQIVRELKKYIKDYEKGDKDIFIKTFNSLESKNLNEVIVKAEESFTAAEASGTDNPSTKVHKLVERLLNLNEQKKANLK